MAGKATDSFATTICSICYEDLKPLIEDLQAISVCGHVFHELCLQQWFEYCPRGRKCSCPVCKQYCASGNVNRLYFQSIGEQTEPDCAAFALSLRGEVTRLEGKLSDISSVVERQGKEIKQLNEELYICRDQLKKETSMRTCALEQKMTIQYQTKEITQLKEEVQLKKERSMRTDVVEQKMTIRHQAKEITNLKEELYICYDRLKKETLMRTDAVEQKMTIRRQAKEITQLKEEELDMLKQESLKLQHRNSALAKEVAALKLCSS